MSESHISAIANGKSKSTVSSNSWNAGFLRPNAFLSIIDITDEDETSYVGAEGLGDDTQYLHNIANVAEETTRIDATLSTLEALKGPKLDNFSYNAIASPQGDPTCSGLVVTESLTLQRFINKINTNYPALGSGVAKAKMDSVCVPFTDKLLQIGSNIIEANARYSLVQIPADPSKIFVSVNGVSVPRTTTNGWDYDATANAVQFYGTAVPNTGDSINIDYTPGKPI